MAVQVNKVMTFGDTVDLITKVHKASANPWPSRRHDGTKGEYDNLGEWFSLRRDGKVYGVDIPSTPTRTTPRASRHATTSASCASPPPTPRRAATTTPSSTPSSTSPSTARSTATASSIAPP
ncbi:MAG: hypothetical protein ACLTYW_00030 [Collinsella sp.]